MAAVSLGVLAASAGFTQHPVAVLGSLTDTGSTGAAARPLRGQRGHGLGQRQRRARCCAPSTAAAPGSRSARRTRPRCSSATSRRSTRGARWRCRSARARTPGSTAPPTAAARWTETFRNTDPAAFYDCLAFFDDRHGLALSDPVDGKFRILATDDGGRSLAGRCRPTGMPAALAGEFAFAASGTCLVARRAARRLVRDRRRRHRPGVPQRRPAAARWTGGRHPGAERPVGRHLLAGVPRPRARRRGRRRLRRARRGARRRGRHPRRRPHLDVRAAASRASTAPARPG